ncbi:hypothetical protein AK812_SmicGene44714, partial [Symbiodinium microadriaticum]
MTQTSAYRAAQEIYWQERASVKRSAPSPAISSLATPQEPLPNEATGPTLVQPWSLQDHTAAQVVAATYGVQPQDEPAMQRWLEGPVRTNKDVLTLVRSYHEKVIRPETYHLVLQLETALAKVGDDLFKTKQEFELRAKLFGETCVGYSFLCFAHTALISHTARGTPGAEQADEECTPPDKVMERHRIDVLMLTETKSMLEAASYITPIPSHQITYRDKVAVQPPPQQDGGGAQSAQEKMESLSGPMQAETFKLQTRHPKKPWITDATALSGSTIAWYKTRVGSLRLTTPQLRDAARDMGQNIFEQAPEEPLFTIAELQTALTKLKKNKAPGPDGITNELYGLLDTEGELNLLQLYNDILTTPQIPDEWYLATVVSIFKGKGSDTDVGVPTNTWSVGNPTYDLEYADDT